MVWPRNFYCELCMGIAGPGPDVLDCSSCNVVMHYACVAKRAGQYVLAPADWNCEFCRRAAEKERNDYESARTRHLEAQKRFRVSPFPLPKPLQ
jgi:hypothetical protein